MYELFGTQFDSSWFLLMGFVAFVGLSCGWLVIKSSIIGLIIAFLLFGPIIAIVVGADTWTLTLPFLLGFSIHTAKPLYRKLTT